MGFELTRARAYAFDTLSGDAIFTAAISGGVFLDVVPASEPVPSDPFCIIVAMPSPDHVTANQTRVWSDAEIIVKLYGKASQGAALETGADRADALLRKRANGNAVRGGSILACYRESSQDRKSTRLNSSHMSISYA